MGGLVSDEQQQRVSQVQWRWRAARGLSSLGRTGWLGLAALLVSIAIAIITFPAMVQRLDRLQQDALAERQRRAAAGYTAEAALPRLLAAAGTSGEFVAAVHTLAANDGIIIERIDYQLLRETGKPVLQYRADLTAQASYLKLRSWIDAVLRERPSVALDELVFERPNPDTTEVTARIRFTHFMRGEN